MQVIREPVGAQMCNILHFTGGGGKGKGDVWEGWGPGQGGRNCGPQAGVTQLSEDR